jgi:uncharacterized protein (TIGR01777 family)
MVLGMPAGVKILPWDGRTVKEWGKEIQSSNAVINLTGENISGDNFFPKRWTKVRKLRILQSRVDAGKALIESIVNSIKKPLVFVQASGIGFYGTNQDKELNEEDNGGNDYFSDLCREWEASSASIEALGIRRIIIRNGVVLSSKAGALPRLLLPYKLFVGGPLGNGRQFYSWIHLEDEVNAISFLIKNDLAHGIYNLTSPNPVTNEEFGRIIGRVIKRPHYFTIPGIAMRFAFGEVASVVLEGQRVIPKKLLEQGFKFKYPTLDKALAELLT